MSEDQKEYEDIKKRLEGNLALLENHHDFVLDIIGHSYFNHNYKMAKIVFSYFVQFKELKDSLKIYLSEWEPSWEETKKNQIKIFKSYFDKDHFKDVYNNKFTPDDFSARIRFHYLEKPFDRFNAAEVDLDREIRYYIKNVVKDTRTSKLIEEEYKPFKYPMFG